MGADRESQANGENIETVRLRRFSVGKSQRSRTIVRVKHGAVLKSSAVNMNGAALVFTRSKTQRLGG